MKLCLIDHSLQGRGKIRLNVIIYRIFKDYCQNNSGENHFLRKKQCSCDKNNRSQRVNLGLTSDYLQTSALLRSIACISSGIYLPTYPSTCLSVCLSISICLFRYLCIQNLLKLFLHETGLKPSLLPLEFLLLTITLWQKYDDGQKGRERERKKLSYSKFQQDSKFEGFNSYLKFPQGRGHTCLLLSVLSTQQCSTNVC